MADKPFSVKTALVVNTSALVVNSTAAGVGTASPDSNWTVNGTSNVAGNVHVGGNLIVVGTLNANLVPSSNAVNLGNTTNRFVVWGGNADFITLTVNGSPISSGGGDVFKASNQTLTGNNTFSGSTLNVSANVFVTGALNDFGNTTTKNIRFQSYKELKTTGTISANQTLDLSLGNQFDYTIQANVTFDISNSPASGNVYSFVLYVTQDGTGSRIGTFASKFKFPSNTAPTLSTGANKMDVFQFVTKDGGTTVISSLSFANVG